LRDNWDEVAGLHALYTGKRLADMDADLLFSVGIAMLYRFTSMEKHEIEAREKLEKMLNDLEWEYAHGLPAMMRGMVGADGSTDSPFAE
jgi:hypothetical protein